MNVSKSMAQAMLFFLASKPERVNLRKVLSSLFLCLILLCSTTMTAFADGNGNVDGGGGNLNREQKPITGGQFLSGSPCNGSGCNKWSNYL